MREEEGTSHPRIGTLIVDDHDDIRTLLRVFIESENEGLFVAGEAASGEEALERIDEVDPKVIVLDHMMPGLSGLETARIIRERRAQQRIVLFSAFLDEGVRREAEEIGIRMCVAKSELESVAGTIKRMCAEDPAGC